jgi:hypothetical protein
MTTEAVSLSPTTAKGVAGQSINLIIRAIMVILYTFLFIFTLVMVKFIEIRQANMTEFNSLIAALEQRDASLAMDFSGLLHTVEDARSRNQDLLKSFDCVNLAAAHPNQIGQPSGPSQSDPSKPSLITLYNKIQDDIFALGIMQDDLNDEERNSTRILYPI